MQVSAVVLNISNNIRNIRIINNIVIPKHPIKSIVLFRLNYN